MNSIFFNLVAQHFLMLDFNYFKNCNSYEASTPLFVSKRNL